MWIIISTTIPIILSIYALSRLQQHRNSHGAQSPTCSTFTPSRFYNHENPNLHRQANTLQSAEERDVEVHKHLVKWDSDEESEQSFPVPLLTDVDTVVISDSEKPKRKSKQSDVKWDAYEEE